MGFNRLRHQSPRATSCSCLSLAWLTFITPFHSQQNTAQSEKASPPLACAQQQHMQSGLAGHSEQRIKVDVLVTCTLGHTHGTLWMLGSHEWFNYTWQNSPFSNSATIKTPREFRDVWEQAIMATKQTRCGIYNHYYVEYVRLFNHSSIRQFSSLMDTKVIISKSQLLRYQSKVEFR